MKSQLFIDDSDGFPPILGCRKKQTDSVISLVWALIHLRLNKILNTLEFIGDNLAIFFVAGSMFLVFVFGPIVDRIFSK